MIEALCFIGAAMIPAYFLCRLAFAVYIASLKRKIARSSLDLDSIFANQPETVAFAAIEKARKSSHAAIRTRNRVNAKSGDEQ